jgi:choline dehydrogenase-like flavoprotein/pimeloyl-ACP methyl ester carboxylesterase
MTKHHNSSETGPVLSRQAAFLSRGLESLVDEHENDFDVVIVGSGYGGAIAAAELSGSTNELGRPIRVCVLERGREYLPGAFPSRQADLAGYVRFMTPGASRQRGVHDGLYDIRWSEDAVAVVASGLGGGSLINAGVMEMPLKEVFLEARWPRAIRNDAERLSSLAHQLRPRLGASQLPAEIIRELKKTSLLGKLAEGGKATPTRITVAADRRENSAGVMLKECLLCGDCATGCNHGAKDSLNLNLFDLAHRAGAQIFTGATVLRVNADPRGRAGWVLHVNHTDSQLRDRQPVPFQIRAHRVILAAGTLGSTEILLRSRDSLRFSAQLGQKFSANGDMLVTAYDVSAEVNAVADETVPPRSECPPRRRQIGPTITSMIDLRSGDPKRDLVIQDLAVPGALRRLFEEVTTTFDVINQLAEGDFGWHRSKLATDDAAINPEAVKKSLVLAMIGRDDASGELSIGDHPICDNADGLLTVRWPELRKDRRFDDHQWRLTEMMRKAGVGGRVVNNPLWRPFSEDLERLFGRQRGPLVTVHPLGGCAMGDNVRQGVTDHCGRVFDAGGPGDKSVHRGLVVLDGSIVPTSLGINPALTIAVLAFRAITQLKEEWKLTTGQPTNIAGTPRSELRQPVFSSPITIEDPKPTLIELTEQVRGRVTLRAKDGRRVRCKVQLTLTTQPTTVTDLIAHNESRLRGFEIASGKGALTILRSGEDFDLVSDMASPDNVALEALVSGQLRLFAVEPSNPYLRTARALSAWIINRGLRDAVQTILQAIQERLHLRPRTDRPRVRYPWYCRMWNFITGILRLCSRAGAARLIEYDLKIDKVLPTSDFDTSLFDKACIRAVKRLSYGRAASPFTQLLEMSLETFPQMRRPLIGKLPVLQLNKRYLAQQQIPLLRVVDQQDGAAGLIDCIALALYLFRVTVQRHALSFRRPDAPPERTPQRLPGRISGLPEPEIDWLTVDGKAVPPVRIRLTRYDGTKWNQSTKPSTTRPVLLIHGYSASGTTFAHPAVPGNLGQTLCKAGRDVWVLDLRCSAGLPTRTGDWPFEVMAQDIPLAVDHVAQHERTQAGAIPRVDIVAHCMGAAMFSIAVLGDGPRQRRLHEKIGRVVFSQIGPVMMLSRTNVLAAYIMRYARYFLSSKDYTFSPQGEVSVAGQLLDRALAAMSMPYNDYKRENPLWLPGKATPWAGTRNRMDALYGRTFSLKNISKGVLNHLDDFFGPVSIETLSQVIHFAASNTVTDKRGINRYAIPSRISQRFDFPLMSIHGEENGLADVATLALMCNILKKAGVPLLNTGSDAAPASLKSHLIDIGYSFSRMLTILGIQFPADRLAMIRSQREITRIIAGNHAALIPGYPSYLTWRIEGHGHQDCLIGKHASTICGVIARYLAVPDQTTAVPSQANSPIGERKRSPSCQAIAPAFGVRARILKKATKIRLQTCDGSGRGPPLRAIVVPIRQVGTRFAFDGKGGVAAVPGSYKLLRSAGVCICKPIKMRKRKRESNWPWFFEVPCESWPSHASAVLVLLLYNQAEGIGGNSRPPRPMLSNCDQLNSPIAKAICEALSYDSIDTLRGGLISGPLIDQRSKERITFALASCLYPSDILNHMPAAENATVGPADASLMGLSNLLDRPESPTLLLLAGDQIYADATAGLFDPKAQDERYRIPHERRGESRGSKAVMQRLDLDVQMMLDDHEIQDNWAPNDPEPDLEELKRAKLAYFLYERASPKAYANFWHKLNHRGLPFFLADARIEREARTARNWRTAKIMKPRQFRELCRWLADLRYEETPKFVMTASALLPRRLTMNQPACALGADDWDGYPLSRASLLKVICDCEIKGVVFLSGDEHLSSVTTIRVSCNDTGKECILHSVHSSGLFSPYPFANGSPEDFIENDSFDFSFPAANGQSRQYQCEAKTQFFPGDGFALLSAYKDSACWRLDLEFHNKSNLKPDGAVSLRLVEQLPTRRESSAECSAGLIT